LLLVFRTLAFLIGIAISLPALANSTIDPTQPTDPQPYTAAPIRNNFQAAVNDVNGLLNLHAGTAAPLLPNIGELWLNTSSITAQTLSVWDGVAWVAQGVLNGSAHTWTPNTGGGTGAPVINNCTVPEAISYYAAAGTAISCLASTGTSGQVLTSNGPTGPPSFQSSASNSNCGTAEATAYYAVPGTQISCVNSAGTAGQVFTSNGPSTPPSFQAASSNTNNNCAVPEAPAYYATVGTATSCVSSAGSAGQVLTSNGPTTAPSYQAVPATTLPNSGYGNFDVIAFGAVGDGTTDDSQKIANAFTACSTAGGGNVIFRPTGHAYVIQQANIITAANTGPCIWQGIGGHHWPTTFYDNVANDWAAKGPWIHCKDTSHPCVELVAPGQQVIGLNFWYTHPTPTTTTCSVVPCPFDMSWTPTVYPPTIRTDPTSNFYKIEDNQIVNAYDCIDVEGPSTGIANMYSLIANNGLGCLHKDFLLHFIDNVLVMRDNHDFLLWYQGSTQVFGYVEGGAGGIGIDAQYVANLQLSNTEFDWKRIAILFTDATVVNGFGSLTFAAANWQAHDLQFNEVCQAMVVQSTSTHFNGGPVGNAVGMNQFTNIAVTGDSFTSGIVSGTPQCSAANTAMFQLNSDNISVGFIGLNVGFVNTLFLLGNGGSGYVSVDGLAVERYSAFTDNLPLYNAAANASYQLCGSGGSQYRALGVSSNMGPYFAGAGLVLPCSLNQAGQIQGNAGTSRQLLFGTSLAVPTAADFGSSYRWGWRADGAAESGSNAGTNLDLDRYGDNGVYIDTPVVFNRATGVTSFNQPLQPPQYTFAGLPACGAPQTGQIAVITDGNNSPAYGGVAAGGGTTRTLVMCNSAQWANH
jgi:hypothetical protein